jgi:hypothetical protein
MELPSVGRSVIMTTRHCVDVAGAWPFAGRLRSAPVPERGIRDGGRGHFAADSLQEQQNRARGRAVRKAGPPISGAGRYAGSLQSAPAAANADGTSWRARRAAAANGLRAGRRARGDLSSAV